VVLEVFQAKIRCHSPFYHHGFGNAYLGAVNVDETKGEAYNKQNKLWKVIRWVGHRILY